MRFLTFSRSLNENIVFFFLLLTCRQDASGNKFVIHKAFYICSTKKHYTCTTAKYGYTII